MKIGEIADLSQFKDSEKDIIIDLIKNQNYSKPFCFTLNGEATKANHTKFRKEENKFIRIYCDVCGSEDVIDVPHMGRNCNSCHPL